LHKLSVPKTGEKMTMKKRLEKLEKDNRPAGTAAETMSDEERLSRMKELAKLIAREAAAQGVTAQDDPRLTLALAIAEVIQ
jgi:hypothetical protein